MFAAFRKLKEAEERFRLEDKHRFRVRTEFELGPRENGLVELADLLEELGVSYFLADGTLLGAARNADLLPWDDDVGLCMRHEDFIQINGALIEALTAKGFEVVEGPKRNPKLNIYKSLEKYELSSWRLRGSKRVRWGLQMPAYLLESSETVSLRGRDYPCPSPVAEYLEHRYGDWRTPRIGRGTHSPSIKTPWSRVKRNIRWVSPQWLLLIAGRDFLPKGH